MFLTLEAAVIVLIFNMLSGAEVVKRHAACAARILHFLGLRLL